MIKQARGFTQKLHTDFNRALLSIIQQNLQNVLPFDTDDEPLGVLQAYQAAVPAQIAKEAKSRFPEIEEALSKALARQFRSTQDVNALRDEAEVYLSLKLLSTRSSVGTERSLNLYCDSVTLVYSLQFCCKLLQPWIIQTECRCE
jgi:hypothetical protein